MKKLTFWGINEDDETLINEVMYNGKTVTCTPKVWYYDNPEEEPTEIGDFVAVYNAKGQQRCIIEITDNYEIRFGDVDKRVFEGELYSNIEDFKKAHYFSWEADLIKQGLKMDDDVIIVVEHFRLVSKV